MKYDISQPVLDREGNPLWRSIPKRDNSGKPIIVTLPSGEEIPKTEQVRDTYLSFISRVLDLNDPKGEDTGEVKSKINQIQDKLWASGGIVDLTVDQVSLINERAGRYGSIFAQGRLEQFLGNPLPKDKSKPAKSTEPTEE